MEGRWSEEDRGYGGRRWVGGAWGQEVGEWGGVAGWVVGRDGRKGVEKDRGLGVLSGKGRGAWWEGG